MAEMAAHGKAYDEEARRIRVELIIPAPADFKSANPARQIRLRLKLERSSVRIGETIRYRLELVNEGSKPYVYAEDTPSFFKTGRMSDRVQLILTEPDGKKIDLRPPYPGGSLGGSEIRFPGDWSNARKEEWINSQKLRAKVAGYLYARLEPGEALRTRGDGPEDGYRTLRTRHALKVPGTYELRAILDGRRSGGTASNTVRLMLEK